MGEDKDKVKNEEYSHPKSREIVYFVGVVVLVLLLALAILYVAQQNGDILTYGN